MKRVCLILLLAAGCTRPANDSLVVVSVSSVAPLDGIARLHTTSTAAGKTSVRDVGPDGGAASLAIPPAKSFGVQLSPSITGLFAIHVEADDASGATLASGDGTVMLAPGQRVELSVLLGAATPDLGNADLANADLANADLANHPDLSNPDLALPAPITAEPIWIGSGGSAASATQQLNLRIGGFDTSGTVSAPSGAQLTSGFFAHQTN